MTDLDQALIIETKMHNARTVACVLALHFSTVSVFVSQLVDTQDREDGCV